MDAPPAIHLRIPALDFGAAPLFRDFALDIGAGAWLCLLGRSGVGKTTLIRAGLGLEAGAHAQDEAGRPLDGRIAWLAQSPALPPWARLRDAVAMGARLRGEPVTGETVARADAALAAVGLGGWETARPAQLSGGMMQRAALARALFEDRPAIFMDEPFAHLDAPARIALQTLAREKLGDRTVLMVTHDPMEAARIADRCVVLDGPPVRIAADLRPEGDAPRGYADAETAAFARRLFDHVAEPA